MWIKRISFIFTIIGALNWGLVGAFNFNLVTFLFGSISYLSQIIYVLVGIAAIVVAFTASCNTVPHK